MTTLLPRNASALERAVDELVDHRLLGASSLLRYANIREVYDVGHNATPEVVLPWMAWGLNSFAWDENGDIESNRLAVRDGLQSNARKGSVEQIRSGIENILAPYIASVNALYPSLEVFVSFAESTTPADFDSKETHTGSDIDLDFQYNQFEVENDPLQKKGVRYGGSESVNWSYVIIIVIYPDVAPNPSTAYDAAINDFLAKSLPVRTLHQTAYRSFSP